jgi:hypothetical protein
MMNRLKFLIIIIIISASSFSPDLFGSDIKITSSVDRTTIGINQTFTLEVELSGERANTAGDPKLPEIIDFATFMGNSGTSTNMQIINGRMNLSTTYSFTFMATKVGKFTIPPVVINFSGQEYSSKPVSIEIVQSSTPTRQQSGQPGARTQPDQPSAQNLEDNLFLKVSINKRRVYVNEPIILSYKIYTRVTVTQYGIGKLPNTAGFWAEEFPLGNQPKTYEEILNGKKYIVAEIKRMALFPTDAGTKTIGPMEIECSIRVQQQRRSIFDSFFDDPFFGRTVNQAIASKSLTVEVLPLPGENKPKNFSGLVGQFNLSADVDKTSIKTNEAISLKVKIGGSGNIKMIPSPNVEVPPDFERYEPKLTENINRTENGVSGSKIFEYVLIPRYPGVQKIKPVFFSYFDITSKKYRTLATPEIVVDVAKGSDEFMTVTSGLSKEEVKLLGKDIRFIQSGNAEFSRIGSYLYKKSYFILLLIFPILAVLASYGYRRHLDKLSDNIAYARSRKANQLAMKKLHKAKKLLSETRQAEFYAEVANSLMGFLGDKFNIASAGIIIDQVEELMKSKNLQEDVIRQYLSCLQVCDYQRFAPSNSNLQEMKDFFNQAKQAIVSLERVI